MMLLLAVISFLPSSQPVEITEGSDDSTGLLPYVLLLRAQVNDSVFNYTCIELPIG